MINGSENAHGNVMQKLGGWELETKGSYGGYRWIVGSGKNKKYSASMGFLIVLACVGAYAQVAEVESGREGEEITYAYAYDPNIKVVPKEKVQKIGGWKSTEYGFRLAVWHPKEHPKRLCVVAKTESKLSEAVRKIWFTAIWKVELYDRHGNKVPKNSLGIWLDKRFEGQKGEEKIPFIVDERAQITEPGMSQVFWFPLSKLFNISEKGAYRLTVQGVVVKDMGEEFADFRKQVLPVVEGTIKVGKSLLEEMIGRD